MPEKQASFLNIFKFGQKQEAKVDSEQLYKDAIKLFKNKDIDNAQSQFEIILKSNPYHQGVLLNLAKIYIFKDNTEQAIELLKKYLSETPNSFEAKLKLSQAYIKNKDFESAIGILNQLKNSYLEEEEINQVNNLFLKLYTSQIDFFKKEKRFKEAIYTYEQIYKMDKDKEAYLFNQAVCHQESKNYIRSIELFNEVLESKKGKAKYISDIYFYLGKIEEKSERDYKAIKIYEDFITQNPNSLYIDFFTAKIFYLQKDYEKAIEFFTKSLSQEKFLLESFLHLANAYSYQKNYEKALEFYEKSFKLNKNAKTLVNIVICKIQLGDMVKAFETLNKINEKVFIRNPNLAKDIGILLLESGIHEKAFEKLSIARKALVDDPEILIYIGKYYKKIGDIDNYKIEIQKALNISPNNFIVLQEMAQLYKDNNDDEKVIETYNTMLQKDRKNKEPLRLMAEFYGDKRKYKDAIVKYNEYLSYVKSDVESIYKLALCYFENIQMDKAIIELERIKDHVFHGFTACSLLSDIYISKGDTERAIKYIEKCFGFSSNYIEGYIKYAKIFANSGQISQAVEYLKYAEKIDPNNKDVKHFINYYSAMI